MLADENNYQWLASLFTTSIIIVDVCMGNFFRMIFEFQRYMSVKRRIVEEEIGVEQDIYGFGGT